MDSDQVFKVGDKVICIAPDNIECATPVRPDYGQDVVISEIRVKKNKAWLIFDSISTKYGFQAKYFRKRDLDFASKILRNLAKEGVISVQRGVD